MQNPPQTKSTNFQKSKAKPRISKRQRNRRRNKQKLLNSNQNKALAQFPIRQSGRRNGADIWREAYENAIRWQTDHQGNYWRHVAKNLQRDNEMLRQQLQQQRVMKPTPEVYYETSDEDEEVEGNSSVKREQPEALGDEVDVKYLEFLQITFKHREELRLKRQAEAQAQEVAEPLVDIETTVGAEISTQVVTPDSG